ncbi:MAG: site-specific DNA-methyltransferase [Planctomycetaceae bacterium]|nr:site-specific DNA-methyltransferase [Planctomycetaceae bacterium]
MTDSGENGKLRKKDSARLVWDTKPRRAANPKDIEFQTAEVVIPNPKLAGELPLSFRDGLIGETDIDKQKMNRLIWGDNLLAMQALLSQGYEGKINLIYIDPPFDSKADYSHKMTIEDNEFTKEPSVIERLAYKDTWTGGTDSYLDMLYPRLQLMKRLLAEDGSLYVHCDWHVNSYIRILLDEIFGKENFIREIIWDRGNPSGGKAGANNWIHAHDSILFYSKNSGKKCFNKIYEEYTEEYVAERFIHDDKDGKGLYRLQGSGSNLRKQHLSESKGRALTSVWNIPDINVMASQRTHYDTQKPAELLELIIKASSHKDGVVADFFAGSGTTGAVAGKLGRQWIMCELGKVGIQVTRSRLVEERAKPFLIENIGNYQREMIYLTGGRIWEMQSLILKLYGATPRDKVSGLGIRKADDTDELVYVGYPDRPITAKKAEELALQAQHLDGRGYKRLVILGWDYEYNYSQSLEARLHTLKDKIKVKVESRDIPPDIYDYLKKARTEEDIEALSEKITFHERPYLKISKPLVDNKGNGKSEVTIELQRYVLMDIPVSQSSKKGQSDYTALMKLAKDNFAVLIDYWAVDWDYDGCTFKSQWQAFRGNGRRTQIVPTKAIETIENKKSRSIAVRVVDIFGNDAAAIVQL